MLLNPRPDPLVLPEPPQRGRVFRRAWRGIDETVSVHARRVFVPDRRSGELRIVRTPSTHPGLRDEFFPRHNVGQLPPPLVVLGRILSYLFNPSIVAKVEMIVGVVGLRPHGLDPVIGSRNMDTTTTEFPFLSSSSWNQCLQRVYSSLTWKKHVRNLFWGNGTENTARRDSSRQM